MDTVITKQDLMYIHTIIPQKRYQNSNQIFYDLLLTDINMPHMNGFELCEKILELDVNLSMLYLCRTGKYRSTKRSISKGKEYRMFYQKTSYDKLFSQKT
jgi:CheY-like chemotaxis protein